MTINGMAIIVWIATMLITFIVGLFIGFEYGANRAEEEIIGEMARMMEEGRKRRERLNARWQVNQNKAKQ